MKPRSLEDLSHQSAGPFAEKRIYFKSGQTCRHVRLRTRDQLLAWIGGTLLVGWSVVATALLVVQMVQGDGQAESPPHTAAYETRLTDLATERDTRLLEARAAQEQFSSLLAQLSNLQDRIFDAELAAAEKTAEVDSLRDRLASVQSALDTASQQLDLARDGKSTGTVPDATLTVMTEALADMAAEREALSEQLAQAESDMDDMHLTARLDAERNDRIFRRLEDAVSATMAPLDDLFNKIGMNSEQVLESMRNRYNGQGGPLTPITYSTKGELDPDTARANNILTHMQELDLYRMAIDGLPLAMPVASSVRRTSGFGYRRDPISGGTRLHAGVDWAGPYGTKVMATADGVVVHAGWSSGYGRLVKIQHDFGIETRYAHLSKINVKVGQRVSRGDKIGAMGNSGRSTGTHLHYEVRLRGKATNPMTYITAARDVF